MLLLVAAACGQERQDGAAPDLAAEGFLGTVTYRYDPELLTAANVRIAVPPGEVADTYAVKLLPVRGAQGSPDLCPGGEQSCPIEAQPGLTLALLERPFDRYEPALRSSELGGAIAPVTVAGSEGIAVDGGSEGGLEVEYHLIPVGSRALLIKFQRDGQNAPEQEALDDVVESLDLGR